MCVCVLFSVTGMATMALASIVKLLAMLPGSTAYFDIVSTTTFFWVVQFKAAFSGGLDARELLSRVCPAAAGHEPLTK